MNKTFLMVLAGVVSVLSLSGCVRYEELPPGTVRDINDSSAILELQEVKVPPPATEAEVITEYRVGPGDVLTINVPGLIDSYGNNMKKPRIIKASVSRAAAGSCSRWLVPLM